LGSGDAGQDNKLRFGLKNAWIKVVEFPTSLAYDSNDPSEIKLTFRYDYFEANFNGDTLAAFGGAK